MDCKFTVLYSFLITGGSLYTLLALTVDRYFFIMKPLHYPLIMTPTRTWLLLLLVTCLAVLTTVLASFAFKLPQEDPHGEICTTTHIFKSWAQIYVFIQFYLFMITVVVIYVSMFVKFRESKKRLEELKKLHEEDYSRSKVSFHENIGIFRKHSKCDVPGICEKQIQTLQIKSLENDNSRCMKKSIQLRKRRSSSVLKSLTTLASHVRAVKYILVLVFVLLLTWTPWFSYVLYENIAHLTEEDLEKPDSVVNTSKIFECLNKVLQDKSCNMTIQVGNENYPQDIIKKILHLDEANIMSILLSMFLSSVNSLANPVLYAFWYPDFRKYLKLLIPFWSKHKHKP